MNERTFAPRKIDIGAFIESGELMAGAAPLSELPRLAEGLAREAEINTLPPVQWSVQGRFVKDEAAAAQLDADCDDDVLALSRQFDLMGLIEDELIMAQPIVPRHDECPTDVYRLMQSDEVALAPGQATDVSSTEQTDDGQPVGASGRPNPFAVLASLKKGSAKD